MHVTPKICCISSRWNMTSCYGGASRLQTSSAIKPSRRPAAPLRAAGLSDGCPAQLHSPIWQSFWKMASSPNTRRSSTRFSPASKRPKRTSARTDAQTRTVIPGALPNDAIIHHPGTWSHLCLIKEKLWGYFAITISRGCRYIKHTQSLYVLHVLQSSYLLSLWRTCAFVSQHCSFYSVLIKIKC